MSLTLRAYKERTPGRTVENSVVTTVRLPRELVELLDNVSKVTGTSRTGIIEAALEKQRATLESLKKRGAGRAER